MTSLRVLLAITLAAPLVVRAGPQDQATGFGRIEVRVTDASGAVMPGVQVTLAGVDVVTRQVLTDNDGRFVFDRVQPGASHVILAELPGLRPDSERDIIISDGQTRTIDLELAVGCVNEPGIQRPDLDDLLTADAIAHVRAGDAGEDEHDGCGQPRDAVVISAVRFTNTGQRIGETFRLIGGASRFERGHEYLLFLSSYGAKHLRTVASFKATVVDGRVRGLRASDVGIHSGIPIGEALTRLREVRERHSRNRSYGTSDARPAGLQALRYKTGWIIAGVISDGSWDRPSFEFVDDLSRPRGLPRPNDRIRMMTDETIYILELGRRVTHSRCAGRRSGT